MIRIFQTLFVLISAVTLLAHANDGGGGYDHGNGGDMCENRFVTVRSDLSSWIVKGGAASLRLPETISLETYVMQMLEKMQTAKVSCTDAQLFVGTAEKTCKNFRAADGSLQIQCNTKRFMETSESDQYVLVHHEYAGLAGFEVNDGEASNYEISNQITGYLEDQITKKLVVKRPPLDSTKDPFDPNLCSDPDMTPAEAKKLVPFGQSVDFAPFTLYTRERWCTNAEGCGEWKRIQNQLDHPDMTKTRKFMLIPDSGIITLVSTGMSEGIGMQLSTTSRGLSGQGAYLVCGHVGEPNLDCMVQALPFFEYMGDAYGRVGKHCSRFTFKHRSFNADKEFFEMEGIYKNAHLVSRGILVERESVILSWY